MIILDNREIKLIELIKSYPGGLKIPYQIQNLLIGDITITHQIQKTNTPLTIKPDETAISPEIKYTIIIERKTVCDMIASIKDGRYKEQKMRLVSFMKEIPTKRRIAYILEGDPYAPASTFCSENDKNTILGFLVSSNLRDGIPVFHSKDRYSTQKIIEKLSTRLMKDNKD